MYQQAKVTEQKSEHDFASSLKIIKELGFWIFSLLYYNYQPHDFLLIKLFFTG